MLSCCHSIMTKHNTMYYTDLSQFMIESTKHQVKVTQNRNYRHKVINKVTIYQITLFPYMKVIKTKPSSSQILLVFHAL